MPTPAARKARSHDRILDVAARAIRRSGFHGVGVADLMKEAGLTHGGFYAHFRSRDALLVEALQRASRDSATTLAELLPPEGAGWAEFVSAYLHDSQLDNAACGCVVAALLSEMPRQADEVRAEAQDRVRALIGVVRRFLPADTEPARAAALAASLVGALQLARTLGGDEGRALLALSREDLIQRVAVP